MRHLSSVRPSAARAESFQTRRNARAKELCMATIGGMPHNSAGAYTVHASRVGTRRCCPNGHRGAAQQHEGAVHRTNLKLHGVGDEGPPVASLCEVHGRPVEPHAGLGHHRDEHGRAPARHGRGRTRPPQGDVVGPRPRLCVQGNQRKSPKRQNRGMWRARSVLATGF